MEQDRVEKGQERAVDRDPAARASGGGRRREPAEGKAEVAAVDARERAAAGVARVPAVELKSYMKKEERQCQEETGLGPWEWGQ